MPESLCLLGIGADTYASPAVFFQIPMGQLLMVIFLALAVAAATGAMLSLMEVPVVIFRERFGLSRQQATLLGSSCALTDSTLANFKLFGLAMFYLFDFVSSDIILPAGGIFIALFTP